MISKIIKGFLQKNVTGPQCYFESHKELFTKKKKTNIKNLNVILKTADCLLAMLHWILKRATKCSHHRTLDIKKSCQVLSPPYFGYQATWIAWGGASMGRAVPVEFTIVVHVVVVGSARRGEERPGSIPSPL